MAEFTQALPFILKHEGTALFVDKENGERSRYGVTEKLLIAIDYEVKDPNLLTIEQVSDIYSRLYWGFSKCALMISQLVANKVCDMSVNFGNYWAAKLTQAALNSLGVPCVIDGMIGPHTIIEINQFMFTPDGEMRFLQELALKCASRYKLLAVGSKAKYLSGWLTRAADIGIDMNLDAFNTLRNGNDDKVVKG